MTDLRTGADSISTRIGRPRYQRFYIFFVVGFVALQTAQGYCQIPSQIRVSDSGSCVADDRVASFVTDIERLASSAKGRTEISQVYISRYFSACSMEEAESFLRKSGFEVGRYDPAEIESEKRRGTQRLILGEKQLRVTSAGGAVPIGSLNCRFILRERYPNTLSVEGFFYVDAP